MHVYKYIVEIFPGKFFISCMHRKIFHYMKNFLMRIFLVFTALYCTALHCTELPCTFTMDCTVQCNVLYNTLHLRYVAASIVLVLPWPRLPF